MKKTLSGLLNWWSVVWRLIIYGSISMTGALVRSTKPSQWAMRQWCSGCIKGLRVKLKTIESGALGDLPQCVYIANHTSALDIPIVGSALQCDYRWLAKSALFRAPFLGWHLSLSGHIPVHRGKHKGKNKLLAQKINVVVKNGASLLFFPEGTRSMTGKLLPFRLGAFQCAVREGLPIVPIYVSGAAQLMTASSWALDINHDHECTLYVFDPIQSQPFLEAFTDINNEDERIKMAANALKEHCFDFYKQLQAKHKDTV